MNIHLVLILSFFCSTFALCAQAETTQWSFEASNSPALSLRGDASPVVGVHGNAQSLNGRSLFVVPDSTGYAANDPGFTLTLWVNPYDPGNEQQILAGKNSYSQNQREWGVMIDQDGRFRLYVWQDGWKTIAAEKKPQPGHWHQVGVVVRPGEAELWLDGEMAGREDLSKPLPRTAAKLTFGGIDDAGRIRQTFFGAIDEARYFDRPLNSQEIIARYRPHDAVLLIPDPPSRFPLWDERETLDVAADLTEVAGVDFHVIKKWDQPNDGYTFLHGVGLAWHQDKLYASFGHNKGAENTVTEEAQYRVSDDGGETWGPLQVIDAGNEHNLAVSHGVFLSHEGKLWAFHGAYHGFMENIHTRAYSLNEETSQWTPHGVVIDNGFWPMNQPVKMDDGNWIMAGGSFGAYSNNKVFPAAVAISHGDDLTRWDFVKIETPEEIQRMWGESSIIVDGPNITNVARYGGDAFALVATSPDYGRTWTESQISNLPMATSKPAAGMLSTGQRYVVCTTARNNGGKRAPLTIALSQPGQVKLSQVLVIRRSEHNGPGESSERLSLSYPCAIEHEGRLFVGFSNNGGRKGNLNSAELAIIPIKSLGPAQ
ncbi:LamG-like jellyroll fold domain-containing protein [Neorhodopirellula pilleata]|uniref:LamG-like jellyroll fold domain-containing protein n=1 Tax=Neorhodopirellula pilleata TaxID=2714738 RepID=A0A5C6A9I0_9BACT|nr:LamG-like jellyroll fold domain-containing protein [Neorhodopirellula pilleata]TWT94983.1 hypothetical protein Pla100_35620 [Neorhodopirellula pilleata]